MNDKGKGESVNWLTFFVELTFVIIPIRIYNFGRETKNQYVCKSHVQDGTAIDKMGIL